MVWQVLQIIVDYITINRNIIVSIRRAGSPSLHNGCVCVVVGVSEVMDDLFVSFNAA